MHLNSFAVSVERKDVNNNGVILYTEFLAATLELHGRVEEKRLAEVTTAHCNKVVENHRVTDVLNSSFVSVFFCITGV